MAGEALLKVSNLALSRGERLLFEGLDFSLVAGQLAIVSGPNGAGKSTLLRALAGFIQPLVGSILLDGEPIRTLVNENRANVEYQGHLDALKRDLTVAENLNFVRQFRGMSTDLAPLLADLELTALQHRRVRHLSAGQRRRTALGRLRLSDANLWLLDEPYTNLDGQGRQLVEDWIANHLHAGGGAVVATHQTMSLDGVKQLRIAL